MALEMVSNGTVPRGTALAVDGQGIYFYYDRKKKSAILNGVNIAVPRGVIYSLLGPSGCGKTTLLKCITGQLKPQEGSLKTYGKTPGSKGFFIPGPGVGYMPQDLALFQDMTAEETLTFFGSLFHMSKLEICERITFLVTLLALPDKTKQIKHLSGGQQRRVSFAVALVHKPPLLILDEPTVGVDPVLRQNIWKHLVGLARNEKSTIIITTHYIEEARKAHVAGLMREGRLLVERNPEDLIRQYRVSTLEQVFLRLCQNSQKENGDLKSLPSVESLNQNSSTQNSTVVWLKKEDIKPYANGAKENCPFEDDENKCSITLHGKCAGQDTTTALLPASSFSKEVDFVNSGFHESWRRFVCLTNKNFLCLRRNTSMMVFQMFLPTIPLLVFCLCVGGYPFDLPVAIVNMEQDTTGYSRTFLNTIDNRTIQQKEFGNLSLALQSVRNGDSWAAVYIGPEFSTCLVDRVLAGAEVINDTVECSDITVYLDMSNQLVVITIYYGLLRSFLSFASDLLLKFGKNPLLASLPLKIEDTVYGTTNTSFTDFLAPGMILTITYIMAVSLTALSVLLEKRHGLLQRTFVAGATVTEVLLSIFSAFLLTLVAQVALMLSFAFLLFDLPCNGPFFWVTVSVMLTGISGMAYGFFISSICQDEYVAVMVVLGSFNPTLVMSGIIWSLEAMPHYLRYISYGLPLTLMARSLRCILIRGWNITDHHIWDGFLISIAWSILFMVLSTMLFKIKK